MDLNDIIFGSNFTKREWHMTFSERTTMLYLLQKIKPETSLEIGTYLGGSLKPISEYSQKVYAFDIDFSNVDQNDMKNVHFIKGDVKYTLPPVIQQLNNDSSALQFVLIDGDHSEFGIKTDIENLLKYTPKEPLYILMHDSFNPYARFGMLTADWQQNPYVHFVEIDFVNGVFHDRPDINKQMWGGMSIAVMLPHKRKKALNINQSHKILFESIYPISAHVK